jgi:hypothetical protein
MRNMTRAFIFSLVLFFAQAACAFGAQMDSASYSVSGALYQPNVVSYLTGQVPLAPGSVTSCGKILTPGTYTLSADITGISGPCFIVATSSVTIDGGGHTVTATNGNTNYAVTATSSTAVGGSAFTSLVIQDIVFSGFSGGGVNASGNAGTSAGGAGGGVSVSSSTLGSIVARGGNASSGTGGAGGSVSLTGTDLPLASTTLSVAGGTGSIAGAVGTISVTGSVLVSNGQLWNGNDGAWLGFRTWRFAGNSYNAGTVSGTTTLSAYTATSSVVTVSGNANFRGTGIVNGTILDSLEAPIAIWNLVNGSILTGTISGNAVFNDTSWNRGTVIGDATFTASGYNSISGILHGDPTGVSSGHSILGTILFSATSSPVAFTVASGSTWSANTSAWDFATSGQNWIFNFSNNAGAIYGNAAFNNSSQNRGVVVGMGSFTTSSYNAGTTTTADFRNSAYNIGTSTTANFYDSSSNSHLASRGHVSVQCDFFDASLPGIGSCPVNATFYHIPYYFMNSVSTNWNDAGNWWFDTAFTEPSGLPHSGDNVFIAATTTVGPSSAVTLGSIHVGTSTTGGGSFSVNLTNAAGPVYFYDRTTNAGVVNGVFHVFGNRSITTANGGGSFTGAVAFHDGSWNDMSLPGNTAFYDTSYNSVSGTVGGDAEFFGTNANNGTVVGVATVYAGATLSGSGTLSGNTLNLGSISNGFFDGVITNITGAITGAVSNAVTAIFSGGGYVASSGSLSGDAEFNATSSNRGIVSGTSTFSGYSYNIGTTSNATFIGDLAENVYGAVVGFVSGVKTRLYTAVAPQIALFRDFTGGAWTVIADNTVVKLLYRNLANLFGEDPSAVTTLVERNGGFILRPLVPGVITSCGVLDTASSTYTLGADISNYAHDACFIVRADGITIDGGNHSVTGASTSTSLYGIVSSSTLSIDSTPDSFSGLTVRNISFSNFAYGLWGRGNDVPDGTGGHGSDVTIENSTIGNIDVNGGDPIEQAGNGGDVSLITSVAGVISSRGGDSTSCGIAGDGGSVDITTDSVYEAIINDGGLSTGCAPEASPSHGSSGRRNTAIVSASTRAALAVAQPAGAKTVGTSLERKIQQQAEGLRNIFAFLPSVIRLFPISLGPLPVFGTEGSNAFSFVTSINSFLFVPLPAGMDSRMATILRSLGVRYEREFVALKRSPLTLGGTGRIPGLFSVSVSGTPVVSHIEYASTSSVVQVVRVKGKEKLSISIDSKSDVAGYFNGKKAVFAQGALRVNAPAVAGRYAVSASSTPMTLVVEVVASGVDAPIAQPARQGIFRRVINWAFGLFK